MSNIDNPIPVGLVLTRGPALPTPDPASAGVQVLQNDGSNKPRWVAAGSVSGVQVLASDPFPPVDGTAWVVGTGTSPTRTLAVKVRDNGTTYTLASITV